MKSSTKEILKSPRCEQPNLTVFPCGMAERVGSEIESGSLTVHLGGPGETDHHPPRAICKARVVGTGSTCHLLPSLKPWPERQVGTGPRGSPNLAQPRAT